MDLVLKHYSKLKTMSCSVVSGNINNKLVTVRLDDADCNLNLLKGDPVLLGTVENFNKMQVYGGRVIAINDNDLLIYSKAVKTDVLELRRDYLRYPVSILADVKLVNRHSWKDACIIDVSYSGMRIYSEADFNIGSIIELNVFLSNNVTKFEGIVVRKAKSFNKFEYGIKINKNKNDIFMIHKKIYNILKEEKSSLYKHFVEYNLKVYP